MPEFTYEAGRPSREFLEKVNPAVLMLHVYLALHRDSKRRAPHWMSLDWGSVVERAVKKLNGGLGEKSQFGILHNGNKSNPCEAFFKVSVHLL